MNDLSSPELVNVVGTGKVGRELNLSAIHEDISEYDYIESLNLGDVGLSVKFKGVNGTAILYRSGKYNMMGFDSVKGLEAGSSKVADILLQLGIIESKDPVSVTISNFVYTVDLERSINLLELDIILGDLAVYEPEQNPFLIYQPEEINGTMTISSSGKCVVNTPEGRETVLELSMQILNKLDQD